MLEAFKASVDRDSAQEQRLLRAGVPPDLVGRERPPVPVPPGPARAATPTRPVRPAAEPSLADVAGRRLPEEEGLTLPFGIWAFLALQLVALGLAYFLGTLQGASGEGAAGPEEVASGGFQLDAPGAARRGSTPAAPASGGSAAPAVGAARPDPTRPPEAAAAAGDEPLSAADRAFADPANRFTVVVFAADDYPVGRERTWAMFEHLRASGFDPVTPRVVRGRLVLLVGAAPRMGDLEKLKLEVRELLGPDGRTRPFLDAWVNNIDNY